jgi:hypothetical protein
MKHTDPETGGPVPRTPWDFPLSRRRQKSRRKSDQPPALKAIAFFTVRRSGCVPAEPYPPNRKYSVAPGERLCYAFHTLTYANGGVPTENTSWFYILAQPVYCPAHGERLIVMMPIHDELIFVRANDEVQFRSVDLTLTRFGLVRTR